MSFHETANYGAYPQMNEQFGTDKDRKSNKESGLHFNVVQKGKPFTSMLRSEHREQQKRQPCQECDDEDSTLQEFQGWSDHDIVGNVLRTTRTELSDVVWDIECGYAALICPELCRGPYVRLW